MSQLGAVIVAFIPVRYGFVRAAALSATQAQFDAVLRNAPPDPSIDC